MNYVKNLYKDIQSETELKDFVNQVFFNGEKTDFKIMKFTLIETGKGNDCIQLKILENTKPTRNAIYASFVDYGVKYCEEGHYYGKNDDGTPDTDVPKPSPRIYKMKRNYLQYMAEHYKGYVEDCKNNTINQKETEKLKELDWLEGVFASTQTPNP